MMYLLLAVIAFETSAQERQFKNFETKSINGQTWILPTNFRQVFELVKQEWIANDFSRGGEKMLQSDSLSCWFTQIIDIKEGVSYDEACQSEIVEKMIPETLRKRMKDEENNRFGKEDEVSYFNFYVVANKTGKILTIYFRVNSLILDLVQEDELQAIYDAVMKSKVDVDKFDFSHNTSENMNKLLKYAQETLLDNSEERMATIQSMYKDRKPANFGVIYYFSMSYLSAKLQKAIETKHIR